MKRQQRGSADRQPVYILDYIIPVITGIVILALILLFLAFPFLTALTNQENLNEDSARETMYPAVQTRGEILDYANGHLDLLQRCADEGSDRFSAYPVGSYRFRPGGGDEIEQTHENYGAARSTFQSDTLAELFSDGVIREIEVNANTVTFVCALRGIAPSSFYEMLEYIPSGEVSDLFGYDKQMRFYPKDGGFWGVLRGRDNMLYYLPITDTLFYSVVIF